MHSLSQPEMETVEEGLDAAIERSKKIKQGKKIWLLRHRECGYKKNKEEQEFFWQRLIRSRMLTIKEFAKVKGENNSRLMLDTSEMKGFSKRERQRQLKILEKRILETVIEFGQSDSKGSRGKGISLL